MHFLAGYGPLSCQCYSLQIFGLMSNFPLVPASASLVPSSYSWCGIPSKRRSNLQGMKLTSCRFVFIVQIVNRILMGSEGKNDIFFCYDCSIKVKIIFGRWEFIFLLVQVYRRKLNTKLQKRSLVLVRSFESRPFQAALVNGKQFWIPDLVSNQDSWIFRLENHWKYLFRSTCHCYEMKSIM